MIIYKITNRINGKAYIGYDTGPLEESRRWKRHKKEVRNKKNTTIFYNAFRSYGVENFEYEVIDNSAKSLEELRALETYYIKKLNTMYPNGYNMNEGGLGGDNFKHMPEERLDNVKKKMSEKQREKIENDPVYLGKLKERRKQIKEISIKTFEEMTIEQLEEYHKLLSKTIKENYDIKEFFNTRT